MPDLVIVPSQVLPFGSGALEVSQNAAVAITAGQVLYRNAASLWALAQCDTNDLEVAAVAIALNNAAAGQPVKGVTSGLVTIGAVLTAPLIGQIYCVSATPGGFAPYEDLTINQRLCLVGICVAVGQMRIAIQNVGVPMGA